MMQPLDVLSRRLAMTETAPISVDERTAAAAYIAT